MVSIDSILDIIKQHMVKNIANRKGIELVNMASILKKQTLMQVLLFLFLGGVRVGLFRAEAAWPPLG